MAEERSGSAARWLIPVGLCLLLGLISVAMAVGAVVPPVGDAMGVSSRGVGGMFGYLFGALFFGGFGVLGLVTMRRGRKKLQRVSRPSRLPAAAEATLLLPAGPGLAMRWAAALPLMLLSSLLPAFGQLALGAWSSLSFHQSLADFGEPVPTFWSEFRHDLGSYAAVLLFPCAALLVFLVRRTMFAAWPKTCLWLAVLVLGPTTLLSWVIDDGEDALPNLALGVGIIWLTFELGRLTLWILSRPVARDVALSGLEIPYHVPGARLRIQRDGLRLDRLRAAKGTVHKVIPWRDLRAARLDEVPERTSWQASSATRVDVPAGPVLRISGAGEEWLLPVTESLGEDLAAAITLRAHDST